MPELPEVENVVSRLRPLLQDQTITRSYAVEKATYLDASLTRGMTIIDTERRGKFILLDLDSGDQLILHLGMTGQLLYHQTPQAPHKHTKVMLDLSSGAQLELRDARGFGRVQLTTPGSYTGTLHHLGPEPLSSDFTPATLTAALARTSQPIKVALLSQRPVAGIGNYLADEILFEARINPLKSASTLSFDQVVRLHRATVDIISRSIEGGGVSMRDYVRPDGTLGEYQNQLAVYGHAGEPCPNCGTILKKTVVGGRGTTYCPLDQA